MTSGILAIWNDCAAGERDTYEAWYQGEHLAERLGVPGIRRGRRYETVSEGPQFFTYYETDSPEVLAGEAYRAILDAPSPLTTRIMSGIFLNMSRTVCRVAARHGLHRGAWAVTLRLSAPPDAATTALLTELAGRPGVARAEAWIATDDDSESTESRLRGGDVRIVACLMVETLQEGHARAVLDELAARVAGEGGVHRLMSELTSADLRT